MFDVCDFLADLTEAFAVAGLHLDSFGEVAVPSGVVPIGPVGGKLTFAAGWAGGVLEGEIDFGFDQLLLYPTK